MEAKKCDKCGRFYIDSESKEIIGFRFSFDIEKVVGTDIYRRYYSYSGNGEGFSKRFDLCPKCAEKLYEWVTGEKSK